MIKNGAGNKLAVMAYERLEWNEDYWGRVGRVCYEASFIPSVKVTAGPPR